MVPLLLTTNKYWFKKQSLLYMQQTHKIISEQVVLLLQGGGALGAYQVGLYKGMHENNIEPNWIIGTSIGAINGSIIAGNPPEKRLEKLQQFWKIVEIDVPYLFSSSFNTLYRSLENTHVILNGVNGFFKTKKNFLHLENFQYGITNAAHYDSSPLRKTLSDLIDFDYLNSKQVRLMIGAVNAISGEMTYFDNYKTAITPDHILASGALPPAFPAIIIEGEPYWDGGVSSNSPVDVFINTMPRVNSVIFAAQLWRKKGKEAKSFFEIKERLKDIRYSSRAEGHIKKEQEIHELRHAINLLSSKLSPEQLSEPDIKKLRGLGCKTQMHFIQFIAPRMLYDDHTKDINFTKHTIDSRIKTGYDDVITVVTSKPWEHAIPPEHGIVVHEVKDILKLNREATNTTKE